MLDIENHKIIRGELKWGSDDNKVPLKELTGKRLLDVKETLERKKKIITPILHNVSKFNEFIESVNNEIEFRMIESFQNI